MRFIVASKKSIKAAFNEAYVDDAGHVAYENRCCPKLSQTPLKCEVTRGVRDVVFNLTSE